MNTTFFITGSTGVVGRVITRLILLHTDYDLYLLLHLQGRNLSKEECMKHYFSLKTTNAFLERIHILKGDIAVPHLGLTKSEIKAVSQKIHGIIHASALTRFDQTLEHARYVNVLGTKNMLKFAKTCKNLSKFAYISTVYVSGGLTGIIYENDDRLPPFFINTYEQTKYEAEQIVREYWNDIPCSIYRLSTIIGDSDTGHVSQFTAPHQALRIMYLGLAALIPGSPTYSIDLIASDYAAKTLFTLVTQYFKARTVYHIVSGNAHSYTLQELIDDSFMYLALYDSSWDKKEYPKPVIASNDAFDLFMRSAEEAGNPLIYGVLKSLRYFAYQLNYPKDFDTTNTKTDIPDYEVQIPDIRDYYQKVVKYCLRTAWGKNI